VQGRPMHREYHGLHHLTKSRHRAVALRGSKKLTFCGYPPINPPTAIAGTLGSAVGCAYMHYLLSELPKKQIADRLSYGLAPDHPVCQTGALIARRLFFICQDT
jgi:hypothetical protein